MRLRNQTGGPRTGGDVIRERTMGKPPTDPRGRHGWSAPHPRGRVFVRRTESDAVYGLRFIDGADWWLVRDQMVLVGDICAAHMLCDDIAGQFRVGHIRAWLDELLYAVLQAALPDRDADEEAVEDAAAHVRFALTEWAMTEPLATALARAGRTRTEADEVAADLADALTAAASRPGRGALLGAVWLNARIDTEPELPKRRDVAPELLADVIQALDGNATKTIGNPRTLLSTPALDRGRILASYALDPPMEDLPGWVTAHVARDIELEVRADPLAHSAPIRIRFTALPKLETRLTGAELDRVAMALWAEARAGASAASVQDALVRARPIDAASHARPLDAHGIVAALQGLRGADRGPSS